MKTLKRAWFKVRNGHLRTKKPKEVQELRDILEAADRHHENASWRSPISWPGRMIVVVKYDPNYPERLK